MFLVYKANYNAAKRGWRGFRARARAAKEDIGKVEKNVAGAAKHIAQHDDGNATTRDSASSSSKTENGPTEKKKHKKSKKQEKKQEKDTKQKQQKDVKEKQHKDTKEKHDKKGAQADMVDFMEYTNPIGRDSELDGGSNEDSQTSDAEHGEYEDNVAKELFQDEDEISNDKDEDEDTSINEATSDEKKGVDEVAVATEAVSFIKAVEKAREDSKEESTVHIDSMSALLEVTSVAALAREKKRQDMAAASRWRPTPLQTRGEAQSRRKSLLAEWRKGDNSTGIVATDLVTQAEIARFVLSSIREHGRQDPVFGPDYELSFDGIVDIDLQTSMLLSIATSWGWTVNDFDKRTEIERMLLALYDTCLELDSFAWGSHPQLPVWHSEVVANALLTQADREAQAMKNSRDKQSESLNSELIQVGKGVRALVGEMATAQTPTAHIDVQKQDPKVGKELKEVKEELAGVKESLQAATEGLQAAEASRQAADAQREHERKEAQKIEKMLKKMMVALKCEDESASDSDEESDLLVQDDLEEEDGQRSGGGDVGEKKAKRGAKKGAKKKT